MFATAPVQAGFYKHKDSDENLSPASSISKKRSMLRKNLINTESKTMINDKSLMNDTSVLDEASAFLDGDEMSPERTNTNVEDELEQQLQGFQFMKKKQMKKDPKFKKRPRLDQNMSKMFSDQVSISLKSKQEPRPNKKKLKSLEAQYM